MELLTLMSEAGELRSALRLRIGNCERAYLARTHFPEICGSFVPFDDDRLEALCQSRRRDCSLFSFGVIVMLIVIGACGWCIAVDGCDCDCWLAVVVLMMVGG